MGLIRKILNWHEENVHDIGSPLGLGYVDRGSGRIAYRTEEVLGKKYKGKVAKVAKNEKGRKDNLKELETWEIVKDTNYEEFFCPIRDIRKDGKILIMDFAGKVPDDERNTAEQIIDKLKKEFASTSDINLVNMGYHPDYGLVIIDYPWGKVK